jgi:hypothetical protein
VRKLPFRFRLSSKINSVNLLLKWSSPVSVAKHGGRCPSSHLSLRTSVRIDRSPEQGCPLTSKAGSMCPCVHPAVLPKLQLSIAEHRRGCLYALVFPVDTYRPKWSVIESTKRVALSVAATSKARGTDSERAPERSSGQKNDARLASFETTYLHGDEVICIDFALLDVVG